MNLSQLAPQVKQADVTLIPNPNHPLGQSPAYRLLKNAGWQCVNSEIHPTDRVPVFRLGEASIRRNRTGKSHWIVEVAGGSFETSEAVSEITAQVSEIIKASSQEEAEALPKPLTPAQEAAASLETELTAGLTPTDAAPISKRIASALALVEADAPNQYNTIWQPDTYLGNWVCDCKDAEHRALRCKLDLLCKHAAAGMIRQRMAREQSTLRNRQVELQQERRRPAFRDTYASPADYRPAADPLNLRRQPRIESKGIGHL